MVANPSIMAISKSKTQILTLFLLSTLTFAIRDPEPLTTPSTDLQAILTSHFLPAGLFPVTVTNVDAQNDGRLTVTLNDDCYVKLISGTLLHYERKVTGVIKGGMISAITGVQMQQPSGWKTVTEMKYDVANNKMQFSSGISPPVILEIDDFSNAPSCVAFLDDWNSKIRRVTDAKV